ncbi:Acetyltransferase GNAT domain-containing protein [Cladophialophora immunda]|nr:Acetyltransferase GNAT domain-containing protein [Cladophialophora immunda]
MATISHVEDGKVEISTARLLLRGARATTADEAALYEAFSDPEVMKYMGSIPHTCLTSTAKWLSTMLGSPHNGVTDFIIALTTPTAGGPVAVGKIGVWKDQEIGFFLARKYWGRGIAQEALNAVIPYFFGEVEMSEITADVDPDNESCIGLLKKAGFVVKGFEERTYKVGEKWCDSLYMILEKKAWQEKG